MKSMEKLPVALSGMCLAVLCNTPVLAQEVDLPDDLSEGPPPVEGMVEISLDADGSPEFNIAMEPNAIQMAAPGGPGPRMMMMRRGLSMRGGHWGRGGCPWLGALDLSDDQYERIYALKNSFLDKVGPKMLEIRTQERHLKDTMTQPSVDAKAARNMQDKINNLRADVSNIKLDNKLAVLDVLTAEQRKKIRDWMIKGGRGMHHRGGPHKMMEKKDS